MNNKIKLGYDDVSIVPERVTDIRHRKECIYKDMNTLSLPIFTAPMDNVIDIESMSTYINNNINTVLPRTISFDERLHLMIGYSYDKKMFFAFSLNEVQELFLKDLKTIFKKDIVLKIRKNLNSKYFEGSYNICIDIANGHMLELIDTIKSIKNIYGDKITIMAGNIANPETYRDYENAGCDYVRCSIGSGSRCVCAGTKIRMSNGELKNIEDVTIGDLVKTTDGDFEVTNTFNKCTDKTILINNNIECTHDHKFLVVRKTDIPITEIISDDKIKEISFYIEAEKLTDEYLLVSE